MLKNQKAINSIPAKVMAAGAGLLLIAILLGNGWVILSGIQRLQIQSQSNVTPVISRAQTEEAVSRLFGQLDGWFNQISWSVGAGTVGLIVVAGLVFSLWRQTWISRAVKVIKENENLTNELEQKRTQVNRFQNERTKYEEDLRIAYEQMDKDIEERTANLSRKCAALEKELNSRRQSEKQLTFQAKELERSKDVLELHVQARTEELQKLKSRYELILNSAGEGIYGLDLQGKTTFVNPAAAKLAGRDNEDMIGKQEHEMFYGLDHPPSKDEQSAMLDQNGHHLSEQVFKRLDGSTFPVEYVRTPITENGRLFGAVVIVKDITERKSTEDALAKKAAELSRSNAELEQFAYVASHDMQEPLRKIQAFGDRLKKKCDDANLDEGNDYLQRMLSAAARMQVLINDLLTFSRVISTSQPFVPVDLTQITREVLSDLEVRIEQTEAKVTVEDLPTVEVDQTQMRQLLQNLISNALKFHKPDQAPEVRISAEVRAESRTSEDGIYEEQLCDLHIEDKGIGFEEKYVDKIFAVFQRLHGRSEFEGTGVGLAVCRRIADRHGGIITAKSSPNEGTTFTVTLPVKQTQQETAQ